MRTTFVKTLTALAEHDPRIMLLTGDLGFTVLENFRDTLPNQFLNAGVAEQNMISVAAGLALSGKRVFVYSIIPFVTFRCLEHIRNDLCYHQVPVCVVGVGGGYSYGHMGSTHHALEDIAVMRSLPHMTVVCPGDPVETEAAVRAIAAHDGPCYLRLGKAGEPRLHPEPLSFAFGTAITMSEGNDCTVIATGNMLETAVSVIDLLTKEGISARLLSMHTVKPIDRNAIVAAARETPLLVTIEEHSGIGGLGSAVAECLALENVQVAHLLVSAPDMFTEVVGSQNYLRTSVGLTPPSICKNIINLLAHRRLTTS
jgi:transketolase